MGEHHAQLAEVLRRVRRRWQVVNALVAWRAAASAAALLVLAAYAAVRAFVPDSAVTLAIGIASAAGVVGIAAWAALAARRAPGDRQVARFIEECCPELEDRLVTAVAARDRDDASPVAAALAADAAERARVLDAERMISRASVREASWRAAAATLSLTILAVVALPMLFPARPAPSDQEAVVEPASAPAPEPPRVERIDLRYEYPAAFGMQPRIEEDGGDIYGPAGTTVHLLIHVDKPVASGALTLGERSLALRATGDVLEGELTVREDGSYRVALAAADGLTNPGDTEYFIRTMEDRPPDVRVVRPASDRQVTPLEEVTIEARADDDFGVAALELVYAVRGGDEQVVTLPSSGDGTSVTGQTTIYVEDLGVRPGDFVTYYARARDVSRGKRSTEARSDMFFLQVSPFEEEFVAAQSQGGASGSGNPSIDELVDAQKDIVTATWRLDRRGQDAGASSADDIRTIARAQADVRRRALAQAAQLQRNADVRRRRPGAPRPAGLPPVQESERALSAAAEAMLPAQQQLEALQTGPALPHEMTALNELMRAQSEVRQREVQRQQAGTGGGGRAANRQQQDLSSLFDRELARLQQTNYETSRATSESRGGGDSDPDLEKVRELARRQQDLNQRQQELAGRQMSEEERRRELERLTREQSELRQQAEELARKVQGLQQASEEMRAATSGLRRQDAKEASARGRRALERLQQLEQQMRGSGRGQGGESTALGELQLESQQIAEAQRRRPTPAEQERLAERMQRLENAVRQQAREGAGDTREALAETARELDRQRLSERMRSAARSPSFDAGEAASIAREVDRVSERLGNATGDSPEARELGEQLSRLTELRERLSALEAQGDTPQSAGEIRQLVEDLRREGGLGLSPGELRELNPGRSAPGTEAWKQDFRRWDALKGQVAAALQKAEASAAARLRAQQVNDRLNAGVAQWVPEQYRRLVDRYYRALAERAR